ncbi:MAG: type II toxin-antitoxin system RelE/ParE family toxin [Acidobacteria bacterium]|nr:type II toxin-antitoxin system RelE/ParE family toxin [Acidobacteriota bacterium]MBE3130150.1 type II toxin-antitoxin system RelE/ParE family toxin [Acidobacteriota bacterium]
MRLLETSKFQKLRKKLKDAEERAALKAAVLQVLEDPEAGKKLKGEFRDLRALRFAVRGQARRLIYKLEKDDGVLFSFGPPQGIYK